MGVWVVRAVGRRRGWRETAELAAGWLDPHLGEFDNVPAPDETLPMGGGRQPLGAVLHGDAPGLAPAAIQHESRGGL